jgi:DNA-binding transcriptional LysR family regulator
MKLLDLDQVQAFLLVAEMKSFTRAAEAGGTSQSAVSLKLKRLEARLGRRLVERTPRLVRLTAEGTAFLPGARSLLAAHQRALGSEQNEEISLTLGVSDHAAGPELAAMLARVNAHDPTLKLEVTVGFSSAIAKTFDKGKLDAAMIRREGKQRGGEKLLTDEFGWFASPRFAQVARAPLRLAMLAAPCGVRAMAIRALDKAKIEWTESFIGGGVTAIAAAVDSGFAAAPLARRIAPPGSVDVGPIRKLPRLPRSDVLLLSHVSDSRRLAALRHLAAAFRAANPPGQIFTR